MPQKCFVIRERELTFFFYWQPSTKSPEDLPNAVTDGTGGQVVAIKQGKVTAGHATLKSIKRHDKYFLSIVLKLVTFFGTEYAFVLDTEVREIQFEEAGQQRLWEGLREDIAYISHLFFKYVL